MLNGKGASFMPTNDSEQKPTQPAGFQSMLARLRGMVQALKSSDENDTAAHEELLPTWDTGVPPPVDSPGDGKSAAAFPRPLASSTLLPQLYLQPCTTYINWL